MRIIIKSCNLQPYTYIAGQRRHDGVTFLSLGYAPIDALEELELTKNLRLLLELNQEVVMVDDSGTSELTIVLPGHPSRHCVFNIEVIGRRRLSADNLRKTVLAHLGVALPLQPEGVKRQGDTERFHFDGQLTTLVDLVAGNLIHQPQDVLAAFGEAL